MTSISLPLDSDDASITFLLGENGSGKSRMLCQLAHELAEPNRPVIAISNTVFDRFPAPKLPNYFRLSPSRGKGYASTALKQALACRRSDEYRNTKQIGRVLQYVGFDLFVGVRIVPSTRISPVDVIDRISHLDTISAQDISLISAWFDNRETDGLRQPIWFDVYGSSFDHRRNVVMALVRNEAELRKAKVLHHISLYLTKNRKPIEFSNASSGELSLISTYAFLATHIDEGAILLIDEPENSLHPRWQRDYCKDILDQFYLYRPKIIIASHSPLIVSGAKAEDIPLRVFTPPWTGGIENAPRSIDGMLMEVFGILVPASHYLSEKVTSLLNDLMFHRIALDDVKSELDRMQSLSYDEKQREFLKNAVELAEQVDFEAKQKRGTHEV